MVRVTSGENRQEGTNSDLTDSALRAFESIFEARFLLKELGTSKRLTLSGIIAPDYRASGKGV